MHRHFYIPRMRARWFKDSGLSPRARLLLVTLAAVGDGRDGTSFVSVRRLERLLRCQPRARRAAERELIAAGLLEKTRLRDPNTEYLQRTYYRVIYPGTTLSKSAITRSETVR